MSLQVQEGQTGKPALTDILTILVLLCLIVTVPANADLRRDLPLGYQEITEVSPGQYRVLARCVETSALLKAVAEKTGKPLVFDIPCNTYVSILHPDKIAPPESWLDYIATLGASLECRLKDDGAWHLYQLSINPAFEPQLSETQILNQLRAEVSPSPGSSGGIQRGAVFCYGVFVSAPYSITSISSRDGDVSVAINDVSVRKFSTETTAAPPEGHIMPEFPSSGQFEQERGLKDFVARRLYPEYLATSTPQEARLAVMEFLRTQQLVEAVYDREDPGDMNIMVRFRDKSWNSLLFPENYDYQLGSFRGRRKEDETSSSNVVRSSLDNLSSLLIQDNIIFFSQTGQLVMPASMAASLVEFMEVARDLPLLEAECVLAELVEDRVLARELAANLTGNYDEAIAQVNAVGLRKDAMTYNQPSSADDETTIRDSIESIAPRE